MRYRDTEHRLLARSVVIPEGEPHAGCWMWMGRVEENGYARIGFYEGGGRAAPGRGAKNKEVHRVAYEVLTGDTIPAGHDADHRCEFRLCIHPNHIRPVLPKDNRSRGAFKGNAQRRAAA